MGRIYKKKWIREVREWMLDVWLVKSVTWRNSDGHDNGSCFLVYVNDRQRYQLVVQRLTKSRQRSVETCNRTYSCAQNGAACNWRCLRTCGVVSSAVCLPFLFISLNRVATYVSNFPGHIQLGVRNLHNRHPSNLMTKGLK